ncbi:1,4-dihydroxy-2-naphthoate polyprenyltransferase [Staphylococcus gallinarum]|jgi:1,4-dihydroxy-2-naphthoate octaprenyltransferase|uniref:1,4-dihydroxy-2-naphthoate octaprenyltransferase n=1 Tax=Staphylococcus gallinarum TaxID=1293 RepID=A0ABQ0XZP4_STAGA|nr:1,4-dihydroxy-2-naphthoate polyprenyltransferase [Staphylococcus gallinarum]KIR10841.1 1,4-dihydroxy-2-naphthoate octaprenyltransferase [Staphylococcus gallinarum]MCD8825457.1 1,4-dihydroxy-2-naphthoate polyprenyltransferase [Staphylococcus gallinarum]MCD8900497.1 1,4-dihydroxy-2-naphthoate polyprenyltransferase [Staphylococcus gallinarum]MCD8901749.1 1,4-dihydroxy-2-naphthoate polyprenyltransferase [Staphylococcus gallinarum]MCD8910179.1 1,4-dihydroxy-2-naphthoate polyprenyltransferase [St
MASQYQQYSTVKKYWHLMRPHTLTAAVVPVLVGTATAKIFLLGSEDHLSLSLFLAMLLACLLIQAATNMFNEYYDFKKGLDDHTSVGIGGAIVRNGMTPKRVMNLAIAFYIIAALLGIFIAMNSSFWLLPIGLVCMAVGYLYTGGPFPISWTPFGELFSGVFMGMFIILISFFIQTENIQSLAIWISIPIVITIGLINMANNIRDRVKDKESGRKTLPILLGKRFSIYFLAFMYIVAYVLVIYITFFKPGGSIFFLLALLSFPLPIKAVRRFKKYDTPESMMPAMAATGKTNTFFGVLYALGIYISALLGGI